MFIVRVTNQVNFWIPEHYFCATVSAAERNGGIKGHTGIGFEV
jgi:hypothetical protein